MVQITLRIQYFDFQTLHISSFMAAGQFDNVTPFIHRTCGQASTCNAAETGQLLRSEHAAVVPTEGSAPERKKAMYRKRGKH